MAIAQAKIEDVDIPEQNLDLVVGGIGPVVQLTCTMKGDEEPDLLKRLKKHQGRVVEAILRSSIGRSLSGIYLVSHVKSEKHAAVRPPVWKVSILMERQ